VWGGGYVVKKWMQPLLLDYTRDHGLVKSVACKTTAKACQMSLAECFEARKD